MKPQLFGTLFYANYLIRAMALYRSLEAHFGRDFTLVMLCMDEASIRILERLKLPRARIVPVSELEQRDPDLAAVKATRSVAEYSWTCAPPLLLHLIDQVRPGESVAYLDADLMFFSAPSPIFEEWGEADILIHEHRFAPEHLAKARDSGIFNVGFVGARRSEEGLRCLERWRAQCLAACRLDPDHGLCGDQKYLEEWPGLYPGLRILRHPGAGLAPWNIARYALSATDAGVQVDGLPLVFYHYHSMRVVHDDVAGHVVLQPAFGYEFTRQQIELIYRPYARRLQAAYAEVREAGAGSNLPRIAPPLGQTLAAMAQPGIVSSSTLIDLVPRQLDRLVTPRRKVARLVLGLRHGSPAQ